MVLIVSTGLSSLDFFFLFVFPHVFPHSVHVVPDSLLSVRSGVPVSVFKTHLKTQVHIASFYFCIPCLQILSLKVILTSPPINFFFCGQNLWSKIALKNSWISLNRDLSCTIYDLKDSVWSECYNLVYRMNELTVAEWKVAFRSVVKNLFCTLLRLRPQMLQSH